MKSHQLSAQQHSNTTTYLHKVPISYFFFKTYQLILKTSTMKYFTAISALALAATVNAKCAKSGVCKDLGTYKYEVDLVGTGAEDPGTCQGGFLDNLRGQCGNVENWGCTSVGGNTITNNTKTTNTNNRKTKAISLSQCGLKVRCG